MEEDEVFCPWCRSYQFEHEALLGTLGTLDHFRCRFCGGAWSRKHEESDSLDNADNVDPHSYQHRSSMG